MKHPPSSISFRLIIASLLLLPVFLGLTGYVLFQAHVASSERSKQQQLKIQSYILLGTAEIESDRVIFPDALQEPKFNQLQSGLFATVRRLDGELLWRSPSSQGVNLQADLSSVLVPGQPLFDRSGSFYRYQYPVIWEMEDGSELALLFTIFEERASTQAQLSTFKQTLWLWLTAVAMVLLLSQLVILRWGTLPLRTLADDLEQIKSGKKEQLKSLYPRELQAVTENLNALIEAEKKQRERYRNTLGDLAHSLKTPLAVMRGETTSVTIEQQIGRMEEIVGHQLKRAVVRCHNPLAQSIAIVLPLERMVATLEKVHRDKAPEFILAIDDDVKFKGDERDLLELLGNVMDNACNACNSQVKISAYNADGMLHLLVEDDGEGVDPNQAELILRRGERADSQHSGQGIGLAVVVDIVSSYRGEITIESSGLGGACFHMAVPF